MRVKKVSLTVNSPLNEGFQKLVQDAEGKGIQIFKLKDKYKFAQTLDFKLDHIFFAALN
jgi:hypothetical protein